MASVADAIRDALVAKLEEIDVAGGFNNDLSVASGGGGVSLVARDYQRRGKLPAALVVLTTERHNWADDNMVTMVTQDFEVYLLQVLPPGEEDAIEPVLRSLVEDVKKRLGQEALLDLPLGVAGVQDLRYVTVTFDGWDPGSAQATLEGVVEYEHRIDDPEAVV